MPRKSKKSNKSKPGEDASASTDSGDRKQAGSGEKPAIGKKSSLVPTDDRLASLTRAIKLEFPRSIKPMLAVPADAPFSRDGWVFEPKLDGIRAIVFKNQDSVRIATRTGKDITDQYPHLVAVLSAQPSKRAIFDGEIIAIDSTGKPSFQLLQQRLNLVNRMDIERAAKKIPVFLFVFDLLYFEEHSLLSCPYHERRLLLGDCLEETATVKLIPSFETDGEHAYRAAIGNGFEGVVAKDVHSSYEEGRRAQGWVKLKAHQTGDFVIGGHTLGQGWRESTFRSLVLGYYDDDNQLTYCGKVGSGFDGETLDKVFEEITQYKIDHCPFPRVPPGLKKDFKNIVWIAPELVVEVKFMDWTEDASLRHPVFLRMRPDKEPHQVTRESVFGLARAPRVARPASDSGKDKRQKLARGEGEAGAFQVAFNQISSGVKEIEVILGSESVRMTNLNRVLWPATEKSPEITKVELIKYLALSAPTILPHMVGRPLSVKRSPHGVHKKCFFQKHWHRPWGHSPIPEYIEFLQVKEKDQEYIACNNLAALVWLGQNGALEFHIASSMAMKPPEEYELSGEWVRFENEDRDRNSLDFPDYLILDIDTHIDDETEKVSADQVQELFEKTRDIALLVKENTDALKISSFVKLSGRTGIHIFFPIVRNLDHSYTRELAKTIAHFVYSRCTATATTSAIEAKKTGKVLIDLSPNGRGKTIISPYSPRIWQYPTVSWPVTWKELETVSPLDFQLPDAMRKLKECPWRDIYDSRKDLNAMLS